MRIRDHQYMLTGLGQICDESGCYGDNTTALNTSSPTDASTMPTLYVAPGAMTAAQAAGAGSNTVFESYPGQYLGSGSPVYSSSSSGSSSSSNSSGSNFWTALTAGLFGAGSILGVRYSVPQLNPGQTITTTAYGTSMSQAAVGQPAAGITSLSSMLSSAIPLLLLAGVAIAVLGEMGHK